MLERIEHVQLAMPSGEEETASSFFIEILGMTEVPKPANLAGRGGCWFESDDGVKLHLGVQPDFIPAKKAHPAFVVDDLEAFRAELEASGVECRDDEPLEHFNRTYISDPFGNRIELMEEIK